MSKIFDEKNISTFKNLKDLATGNKLVGRREIIIGIDERAIQELKNYIFKADMFDEYLTAKCDSYEKYWKQANRDIQAYEKELREYVASLLYDNDYKSQALEEKDKEITILNNIINELEKYIGQEWYCFDNESVEHEVAKNILDKLKELKESGNND